MILNSKKIEVWSAWLIFLLVILLGLLLLIGGFPEIERWRVAVFWRVSEALLLLASIKVVFQRSKTRLNFSLTSILLLLLVISCISVLVSNNVAQSIWGNYFRRDGIITLAHSVLFSISVAILWSASMKKLLERAVVVSTIIISGYVVGHYLFKMLVTWFIPDLSTVFTGVFQLPNENMIAGFIVVSFPFFLSSIWSKFYKQKKHLLYACLPIIAILVTSSLGAIVTAIIGSITWLMSRKILYKKMILSGLVFLVFFILLFVWWGSFGNLTEGRGLIFRSLLIAGSQKPLLGWGWSSVDWAFSSGYWEMFGKYPEVYLDKAHSLWLEYFVTTGIVGLAVYMVLKFKVLRLLLQRKQTVLWLVLLLFIIHSQTNVISIAEEVLFWFVVGICLRESNAGVKTNNWYTK